MKTALIQCNSVTGDLAGNTDRILAAAHKAQGADLCVLPATALCGVEPASYLAMEGFPQAVENALDRLAAGLAGDPALLIACPRPKAASQGDFSDVAVLLDGGEWRELAREGNGAPTLLALRQKKFGVLTAGHDLSDARIARARATGLDALIVMGASQWRPGIQRKREKKLAQAAADLRAFVLAVNTVGGNDCAVFNGQSTAYDPAGELIGRARAFEEDVLVVDDAVPKGRLETPCACEEEETWKALVLGTRDFVQKCGAAKVLLGLSGGVDSALVCCIAVEALGAENVVTVRMPSPYSSRGSLDDAAALAENLGIPEPRTIPIEPAMTAFSSMLAPVFSDAPAKAGDVTFENLQARIRGTLLNALANRMGALILNTGNKSEAAMGYSTLYGDTVGALAVIGDLTKMRVYALCRWFNAARGASVIPDAILTKAPSAELRPNQKDSDSLPPYEELDAAIEGILPTGGRKRPEAGVRPDIFDRICRAEFKRRQEPPALAASATPFGKGWSVPIAGRFRRA